MLFFNIWSVKPGYHMTATIAVVASIAAKKSSAIVGKWFPYSPVSI